MKAEYIKIQYPEDTSKMEIVLLTPRSNQTIQKVADLKEVTSKGKLLDVEIKQHRKKRSLDANAYCWIISDKIAKVIGNTKEYVYKQAVKQVGDFEIVPIKDEVVDKWIRNWESKGLGWQSEILEKSKLEGYTNTINYFGSSTYDTKQMSVLLEEIVTQAKELGIETMTDREKEKLIASWKGGIVIDD